MFAAILLSLISNADVTVIPLSGSINPASAQFVESWIEKSQSSELILIELDTPGGLVSSTRLIAQAIDKSKVPVAVFITPAGASATSAGALITLSSHLAAMSPGSNIGAAHPVGQEGKDIPGDMKEKAVNDVAAFAKSMAQARGRNVTNAELVVTKSKSFTAEEAQKDGIVDFVAENREDFFKKLVGHKFMLHGTQTSLTLQNPKVVVAEMTMGQKLLHLLANPSLSAILMSLGFLLIYVEVSNPGITVAGVLGAVCLIIAFMSLQMLPIQIGGIVLLGFGMIMMVADLFVTSKGALTAGGFISFLLGLIWFLDQDKTDLRVGLSVLIPTALGFGSLVGIVGLSASRAMKLNREALKKMGGSGLSGLSGYTGVMHSVSANGLAGVAHIRGEIWDVVSDEVLGVGDTVAATGAHQFKIKVKKLHKGETA